MIARATIVSTWLLSLAAAMPANGATEFRARGIIFAQHDITMSATVPGVIKAVCVHLGDRVSARDTLVVMDDGLLSSELAVHVASLSVARAELEEAMTAHELAEKAASRLHGAPTAWSQADLDAADNEVSKLHSVVEQKRSAVAREEASVQHARIEIAQTVIRAPFSGSVALVNSHPGDYVEQGSAMLRLVSDSDLWVRFAVTEGESRCAAIGATVRVLIKARNKGLTAVVRHMGSTVDPTTQARILEAKLNTPATRLRVIQPGMTAEVECDPTSGVRGR